MPVRVPYAQLDPTRVQFIQGILTEANWSAPDDATRNGLIEEINHQMEVFLNSRIADQVPKNKAKEFESAGNYPTSSKQWQTFVLQNVPNGPSLVAQSLIAFRNQYLGKT